MIFKYRDKKYTFLGLDSTHEDLLIVGYNEKGEVLTFDYQEILFIVDNGEKKKIQENL
jgi:hypothetical protein